MIHAKQYGSSGPNLIVIHGLFGNADNWHSIAQTLSKDVTVYCIDLPNHGKSAPMINATYPNMANAILEWTKQAGITHFSLLGHSMGGKVAMQIAAQATDQVSKLIIADMSPVDYQASHTKIFEGLKTIDEADIQSRQQADRLLSEYEPSAPIRQFLLKNLERNERGFKLGIARENIANSYQTILKKPEINKPINTPTLFIKGENSDYIIADYQQSIMSLFPNASFKMIPDTGHWLHAEKPVPFTSLVRRFLNK
ncbi:alpha/beta fold hydrolase [Marinomonas transparens]|uniref:Alpha/beta fold hydrolase n=1 Tax=Marinomonas transparens TaxID=2795388 RepID=A0A934JXS1_9GAMM|nr:alpha/beta fold hydrolase [Marinomonas transparens]MBJ7539149.1 alpha/beta fold hydrolase [Marinomonas transparens]